MEIQFLGAARTITGSMHRVKANGKQFLFDCSTYERIAWRGDQEKQTGRLLRPRRD